MLSYVSITNTVYFLNLDYIVNEYNQVIVDNSSELVNENLGS